MDPTGELELGVSDFVALLNQTFDFAYPSVAISGELANMRVSKNRWLYFDLKDELSTVKFFGTVQQLPGPLEDGMLLKVRGQPHLHNRYGFSVSVRSIRPAGEGTICRAAQLLQAKLTAEGLFDDSRKRPIPYPPAHVGLVTSTQSAAYADFMKIIQTRWQGIEIEVINVQVQGEAAPAQLSAAVEQFNALADPPEVLVLIRGGGSPEDLAAFSTELVTRAVAASRVPTLVAIGHEIDISLAELAADRRASTPSNAAELLVPDRSHILKELNDIGERLGRYQHSRLQTQKENIQAYAEELSNRMTELLHDRNDRLADQIQLLEAYNPEAVLKRGYAIVRQDDMPLRSIKALKPDSILEIQLRDGRFTTSASAGKKRT